MGVFTGEDVSDLRLSTPLLMQLIKTSLYLLQAKKAHSDRKKYL